MPTGSGCHKHVVNYVYGTEREGTACSLAMPVGAVRQHKGYRLMMLQKCWQGIRPVGAAEGGGTG